MDGIADLEQNMKLSDLEKRLSQVELKLENIMKLVQLVVTLAGTALGVDLIPLLVWGPIVQGSKSDSRHIDQIGQSIE